MFKNENKSEEMLDILKQIRGYSLSLENGEQDLKSKSIPIVGDQLTVERGANIIEAVQNSFTPEKLEGIHMEIADWHTAITFLNVSIRGGVGVVLPRTLIGHGGGGVAYFLKSITVFLKKGMFSLP